MDHGVLVLVVVVEVAAATAVEHGSFCSWMSAEVGCGVRVLRLVIDRAYVSWRLSLHVTLHWFRLRRPLNHDALTYWHRIPTGVRCTTSGRRSPAEYQPTSHAVHSADRWRSAWRWRHATSWSVLYVEQIRTAPGLKTLWLCIMITIKPTLHLSVKRGETIGSTSLSTCCTQLAVCWCDLLLICCMAYIGLQVVV